MAQQKITTPEEQPEQKIEKWLSQSSQFIEKNNKQIILFFVALCVVAGLVFAYIFMYKIPREQEAANCMYPAMQAYEQDSLELALNGNSEFIGLIEMAETYSGTKQANMANHIIGICYLNLGKNEEAIEYLEKFDNVSGNFGEIISAQNTGLIGDAYVQLGDQEKGLSYYEKAADQSDNAVSAPIFLFKAAGINCSKGNYQKAYEQYLKIKNSYPQSPYSSTIEKYIIMAQQGL